MKLRENNTMRGRSQAAWINHIYGTQPFTGLTFSLSVAFMKLFIQNEMLSFTPTTREKAGKQSSAWTSAYAVHHRPAVGEADLLVWAWLHRWWVPPLCSPGCQTRRRNPCSPLESRGKKAGKMSGYELHVKRNNRYLFLKMTFMSLLCAGDLRRRGVICGASTCVNPVKCGWFLTFFL